MAIEIHDFVDPGLGHSSYVIDIGDGTAAVVDPPRFPDAHEHVTASRGLRLAWTIDTHSHADYVTGSPSLSGRTGATFVAPVASRLETAHTGVVDGQRVQLAPGIDLVAIATPGHTPDHHGYALHDHGRPVALFTGGSLMVGTVGRTDLCGPHLADALAHEMYKSLRRFDDLPDDVAVFPTPGAGSFCSAPGDTARTSTLGHERATNPFLRAGTEDEFVAQLTAGFGTFPTYFARLPELNRRGPRRIDNIPSLKRLSVASVAAHLTRGAVLVDSRPISSFATGHVPGSLSNTLRPVFGSWLGWLVAAGRPLIFVAATDDRAASDDNGGNRTELVRQCLDIGHENLLGQLEGGTEAWAASGRNLHTIALVGPTDISSALIDVRQANEFAGGHVPGARNTELAAVHDMELPSGPVTMMCGHGERAMTAASILAARDHATVCVLDGGPSDWAGATGRSLESGA